MNEIKSWFIFVIANHKHRGIRIEGTSMHLNCFTWWVESLSFLKSSKGKRKYSRVAPAQTARLTRAKRFGQLNCKGGGGVSRGTVVLFQKGRQSSRTLAEELPQLREGKKKEKDKEKTNIAHWFHDSYWFRRRQFNHGSVVAECPSRQREELALRFSSGSESAVAAAMSQGRVTQGTGKHK